MTDAPSERSEHHPYRGADEEIARRERALVERWAGELERMPRDLETIYSRRVGRITFGILAFVGMLAILGAGVMILALGRHRFLLLRDAEFATLVPAGGLLWLLAIAGYVVARVLARRRLPVLIEREWRGRPRGELLAAAEALAPTASAARLIHRLEARSLAWPLAGFGMILPLSLHFLAFLVLNDPWKPLTNFGVWIGASAVLVGHCHLAIAYEARRLAGQLRTSTSMTASARSSGWRALMLATGLSLIPGLFLLAIPTFLVFATGLVVFPWLFPAMMRVVRGERDYSESLTQPA